MKAVLLGQNNPLHAHPKYALYPVPRGSAGYRLYALLRTKVPGLLRGQYLCGFDRANVLNSTQWCPRAAQAGVPALLQQLQGRTVVVLGQQARAVLHLPPLLVHPLRVHGVTWRQLPHPSGRNLWYNDEKNCDLAATLLAELYAQGQKL